MDFGGYCIPRAHRSSEAIVLTWQCVLLVRQNIQIFDLPGTRGPGNDWVPNVALRESVIKRLAFNLQKSRSKDCQGNSRVASTPTAILPSPIRQSLRSPMPPCFGPLIPRVLMADRIIPEDRRSNLVCKHRSGFHRKHMTA